jgi:cellulose synthase/poly-beta-1,6-N-acetylglucosamine synthase-like glycosyltransferase
LLDYAIGVGGFVALSFSFLVYLAYFLRVIRSKDATAKFKGELLDVQGSSSILEPVSVIVNTFNEAKVIGRKLANISQLNYPLDKLEIIVIDDASIDGTADIAEEKIRELKLFGRVIRNNKRIGLNRSLNIAMNEAQHNYVCVTDSDVILEKDALRNSVKVLSGLKDVGGVTGKIQPTFNGQGVAQSNESAYRSFYHHSMLGETALHSAFPGNGPLIVFNKSLVSATIPVDYGSTDGNIAANIIKSGYRFVYVPNAVVLEPVPENIGQQRLQKVRRAKRLIQVFLHNSDIFLNKKYGKFGSTVFPLKFLLIVVCPILMCAGLVLLVAHVALFTGLLFQGVSVGALFIVVGFTSVWKGFSRWISSFVFHQLYLVVGLFSSARKSVFWKTIERKKIGEK